MSIAAITGHRPKDIGPYNLTGPKWKFVRSALEEAYDLLDVDKVIVGMAQGVDQLAARVAASNGIPYLAAVPFAGQELRWPKAAQEEYNEILFGAEDIVYVSEGDYAPWKMHKRNEWMVDNSDLLVAVWNGKESGGTYGCVQYGLKIFESVWRIDPQREQTGPYDQEGYIG